MSQKQNDGGSTAIPFLFGAILGAGVALLLAPMSGKDIRRRLAKFDPDTVNGMVDDAVSSVSNVVDRGVDAFQKASAEAQA